MKIATNLDAIIKVQGFDKLLPHLQSNNEEILAKTCQLLWIAANFGSKYQNAFRAADKKLLVSSFVLLPKLLLHYEETIALQAAGAMCSLADKNSKS